MSLDEKMAQLHRIDTGTEEDVHVRAKPETDRMASLYTISAGNRLICKDMPRDAALRYFGEYLDEMVEAP